MATVTRGYSFGSTEQVTNTKLHALVDSATVTSITNSDIDSGAAISDTKLDLATIAQAMQFNGATTVAATMTMSAAIFKPAKGADVASVAGTMTLGDDGNVFDITGTNAITGITAKTAGTIVVLQFDSTATLTDGGNLKLAGNFTGAAESTLTLFCDGTNWVEMSRSPISSPSAATQAEMETATSTSVYVSPGRLLYHPGAAKALCTFSGTATGTNDAMYGYNVSSVTRVGAGRYTINFITAFSDPIKIVFAGSVKEASSSTQGIVSTEFSAAASTNKYNIITTVSATSTIRDWDFINVIFYGDI